MVKNTMNNGNSYRDYYFILNMTNNASASEIRRAYRRLALGCHPDHHPEDPAAEEKFKLINEAYSILGNVQRRREYDSRNGTQSLHFHGDIGGRYRFTGRWNGCDRQQCGIVQMRTFNTVQLGHLYEIFLTSREAEFGTERFVVASIEQKQRGYRIRIPAGVSHGSHLKAVLGRNLNRYIYVKITIRDATE